MTDEDTLIKLLIDNGPEFDAIPAALVPQVRRLLFAAMHAARAEQAERCARYFDEAARLDPNEWFPPAEVARLIRSAAAPADALTTDASAADAST